METAEQNLTVEYGILRQILRRNNNQHGKSVLFSLLRPMNRRIGLFFTGDTFNQMKIKFEFFHLHQDFTIFTSL